MKATTILRTATSTVKSRGKSHGLELKASFEHVSRMWSAYLGHAVSAADVLALMQLLKLSRVKMGDAKIPDHYIDTAGYAALMGELNSGSD